MHTLIHTAAFGWIAFAPFAIVGVAGFVVWRMSRRRWVIHLLTFACLLLALPIYVKGLGILDPSMISYPGPGDGFVVLLYLVNLVPAVIGYSIYALVTCRRSLAVTSPI
jgi:hypothetical protein